MTIAIDGPSGSGKSVLAQALARRLGYRYLDTGALYRAVALAALRQGVPIDDPAALSRLAESLVLRIEPPVPDDGRQYTVLLDGEDVTWTLRTPEVERVVSAVAAVPGVRRALIAQQQRLAAGGGAVLAGRDIGTVVLPNAELKIYLDASPEVRARRRQQQLREQGIIQDYASVLADIHQRDQLDSTREAAPLRRAADAIEVRNETLTLDELVEHVMRLVEEQRRRFCSSRSP
ncbi:MAG: (d)CMP kinase [Chloroflexi bacterium]|nr:(d)CMP kinase [Chloroflexota bacterium]